MKEADDIEAALARAEAEPEILSAVIAKGERMGVRGMLNLRVFS